MSSSDKRKTINEQLKATGKTGKKSVEVVFDLSDSEQVGEVEMYRAAFGEGRTEVEPLVESKIVLRIYPGSAEELR